MKNPFIALSSYLQQIGVSYHTIVPETAVCFNVDTAEGDWCCTATLLPEQETLLVHAILPWKISPTRMTEMALYVNILNRCRPHGNFELDLEEGILCYKTVVEFRGSGLSWRMIDNAFFYNAEAMNKALPEFKKALHGKLNTKQNVPQRSHFSTNRAMRA